MNFKLLYSITGITQISDDTLDEEWDKEDVLPLLPMGTHFQNFVNFDNNIATERDTGTDGVGEKDFLQETRNIHESAITTDNDIDDDNESHVEIDNELHVPVYSLPDSWDCSAKIMGYGLSTMITGSEYCFTHHQHYSNLNTLNDLCINC